MTQEYRAFDPIPADVGSVPAKLSSVPIEQCGLGSVDINLSGMDDLTLVEEYAVEYWADGRSISTDPLSRTPYLKNEILRRLASQVRVNVFLFTAYITLIACTGVVITVLLSTLPLRVKIGSLLCFFLWCTGITIWVNYQAGSRSSRSAP